MVPALFVLLTIATGEPAKTGYFAPPAANEYVSLTGKYLYVVWALPKDLGPLRDLSSTAREEMIAKTAVYLCAKNKKRAPEKDCLVHMLRLNSNDEYSTSMANAYVTIGKVVLPGSTKVDEVLPKIDSVPRADLLKIGWLHVRQNSDRAAQRRASKKTRRQQCSAFGMDKHRTFAGRNVRGCALSGRPHLACGDGRTIALKQHTVGGRLRKGGEHADHVAIRSRRSLALRSSRRRIGPRNRNSPPNSTPINA